MQGTSPYDFLPNITNHQRTHTHFSQRYRSYIQNLLPSRLRLNVSKLMSLMTRLHLALFFLNGSYYTFMNRIFGIRYVKTRVSATRQVSQTQYKFLGYLLLVQILGGLVLRLKRKFLDPVLSKLFFRNKKNTQIEVRNPVPSLELPQSSCISEQKCPICTSSVVNASATTCGHVFCWKCIVPWLSRKPQCPLCRQACSSKEVLCLYDGVVVAAINI